MMAAQHRSPTVWEMCRLLSGNGISRSMFDSPKPVEFRDLVRQSGQLRVETTALQLLGNTPSNTHPVSIRFTGESCLNPIHWRMTKRQIQMEA
jgi:hypothetical protein